MTTTTRPDPSDYTRRQVLVDGVVVGTIYPAQRQSRNGWTDCWRVVGFYATSFGRRADAVRFVTKGH